MKKLVLSCAILLSSSCFAANLMPKYECELSPTNKVTVFVSADFLCGSENKKYEMAVVTPSSENDELGSVDTGTISYSSNFMITATMTVKADGVQFEMPITMDMSKDGHKGNSTFKTIVDLDAAGKPVYSESKVTCSSTVQYNMDC